MLRMTVDVNGTVDTNDQLASIFYRISNKIADGSLTGSIKNDDPLETVLATFYPDTDTLIRR